jgi:DNA polymerase III subunit delta
LILQSLEELERELRAQTIHPVYLVLGPESYQCRQAVELLKQSLLNSESFAFDYAEFVAGETPADKIIEAVNTFPMVSKRRVVLVTQAQKLKDAEQDSLLSSLKSFSSRSTLILFADELDRRKKFYKALRDAACVAEFPYLKGAALERWAEAFSKNKGYRISSSAIRKIVELAGSDLQSVAMELEKVLLFAGKDKQVPDSAVDDLVRESRQQSIFELINAVARRDRSSALKYLANLVNMGEHPLVVVTMLARHCRQTLIAQEGLREGLPANAIASAAQIPPFLLDQFLRQARSTDSDSVQKMFVRLAEIDRQLKSSAADGRMLLESLICALV